MVKLALQPPGEFDFKNSDDWPCCKRRFELFRVVSGLSSESAEKQAHTLLYCLGEGADAVLTSTDITDEERKVYDTVVAKLNSFFRIRKNIILERASFNRRNQQEGEALSTKCFVTAWCWDMRQRTIRTSPARRNP